MPQLVPLEVFAFPSHFYCDFIAPSSWDPAFLTFLENEIHRELRKDYSMKVFSMMKENASVFLKEHKMDFLSERVLFSQSPIVTLLSLDSAYELVEGEIFNAIETPPHIVLCDYSLFSSEYPKIGEYQVLRIIGSGSVTSKEASHFKRLFKQAKENDPVRVAKELEYFYFPEVFASPIWLQKGLQIRDAFDDRIQTICSEYNFMRIHASSENVYDSFAILEKNLKRHRFIQYSDVPSLSYNKDCRGLFATKSAYCDEFCLYLEKKELVNELKDILNFIKKVHAIFKLSPTWIVNYSKSFKGFSKIIQELVKQTQIHFEEKENLDYSPSSTFEAVVKDAYGTIYPISCIEIRQKSDSEKITLYGSSLLSLERVLGLLLEKNSGFLPFALSPVQMRCLLVGEVNTSWGKEVQKKISSLGYRIEQDERKEVSLSSKIYECQRAKIPISFIIGKKEVENQNVMLRVNDESLKELIVERPMNLDEVISLLQIADKKNQQEVLY